MGTLPSTCVDFFVACCEARKSDVLIERVSQKDKEFHFQNWVQDRLSDAEIMFDPAGRNSYPDFTLVNYAEGYEVKGLGLPGREASYDSNSRVPTGYHNGRTIYYVFGRYPSNTKEDRYSVIDLVVCHGDFINANHTYVHKNDSFRGFGSYGDLLIRDRKMYVAPTPFALADGTSGQATLIVPAATAIDERIEMVGELVRIEAENVVIGYSFDLKTNVLTPRVAPNPSAGKEHRFVAYRLKGHGGGAVSMRNIEQTKKQLLEDANDAL